MRSVLVLAFVLAACSDATAPDPEAAAVGNYVLMSVNGGPLPALIFQNAAGRIDVISGALTLRADRSFTEARDIRTTSGTTSRVDTARDNGGYSVTGTQITFTIPPTGSQAAISYTGAASNSEVAYTWNNVAYRYRKQ
jgi:hypothetical protein